MAMARNGDVEIYYETFGDPAQPTLLLVNGLGSQCINYAVEWCELFCAEGFQVIRFDNRDVGLSTKLDGVDYSMADMAADAIAVLDAVGVDRAHVMGCSMGGMIVQRLAIDHPDRLLSMTSVMSRTGEPGYGESSEEALAVLMAPPAPSIARPTSTVTSPRIHIYGSKPEWLDDDAIAARAAAAYDRCFCPKGIGRQMRAVGHDGSRTDQLRNVRLPDAGHPRQPGHLDRPERRPAHRGAHPRRALPGDRRHGPRLPAGRLAGVGRRLVRVRQGARGGLRPEAGRPESGDCPQNRNVF